MKKKGFSNIYLLYCLSDTIHIHVISVCKFFVVKFVLVLAFFIHLMVIGLYFFFFFFFEKKINLLQNDVTMRWHFNKRINEY